MSSVVDICNLALGHIGNDNQISSISPPDGSTEAGYCARFYPVARKEMLESADWGFATTRVTLAQVANTSRVWSYAYAKPSACLRPVKIFDENALAAQLLTIRENAVGLLEFADESGAAPFKLEGGVIRTHQPEAVLLYVQDVTDSTKFTALFTSALGYLLGSYIAGPIIRGAEGAKTAQNLRELALGLAGSAMAQDARGGHERHEVVASHLKARQ